MSVSLWKTWLLRRFHAIARDTRGSIATMFAMSSIPLVAAAGVAIDYNRIIDAQTALQSLADRAALDAAAFPGTETKMEEAGNVFLEKMPSTSTGSSTPRRWTSMARMSSSNWMPILKAR